MQSVIGIIAGTARPELTATRPAPQCCEDGADRRVTRVRITQTGMKVLARSRRRKEELLATRLRGLSDRDLETLDRATHILDRLTGGEP